MGEARRRAHSRVAEYSRLTGMFRSDGVNTDEFSFYDQAAFLEQEKSQPTYLVNYAKWVMLRPADDVYRARVRSIVPRLAQLISRSLIEDQWEGPCIVATALMTRMLDRLKIWSYGVVGSATFTVEEQSIWRGLHSIDYKDFPDAAVGHAWVCAPPYFVVDASASLQRWGDDPIRHFIPQTILDDTGVRTRPLVSDVVSPRVRSEFAIKEGREDRNLHYRLESGLQAFGKDFPAIKTASGPLTVKYIPVAIRQTDTELEDINRNGQIGRTGRELWEEVVKPELLAA